MIVDEVMGKSGDGGQGLVLDVFLRQTPREPTSYLLGYAVVNDK